MPDYLALKAEIAKPAYAGLTDAEIVAALTTNTVSPEVTTSGVEIGKLWARRGVLGMLWERATRTGAPALTVAQRQTAWTAIKMVEADGFSGLDPTNAGQRAALVSFLDGLVTDGIMTNGDKTATLALLVRSQTVGASIGWAVVWPADLVAARAMVG